MPRNRGTVTGLVTQNNQQPAAKDDGPITFKYTFVTPELAKKWLEHNFPKNRPVGQPKVDAISGDIDAGNWTTTHQAICFDVNDVLIDGQHRLLAIIQAGKGVWMYVAYSKTAKYSDPIDLTRQRSISHILDRPAHIVAASNVLRALEVGFLQKIPQTPAGVSDTYARHEKWIEMLEARRFPIAALPGSVRGAIIWSLSVYPDEAMNFASEVVHGEMIQRGDPAYAYRMWRSRNQRIDVWSVVMAALTCLAHQIRGTRIVSVNTGPSGYRAITGARRRDGIEHTPIVELVPSGTWPSSKESPEDSNGD